MSESVPYVRIEQKVLSLNKLKVDNIHTITSNFKVNQKYYEAISHLYIGQMTSFDQNTEHEIDATSYENHIIEEYKQKQPWYEKHNKAFIGTSCFFGCTTVLFGYLWWKKNS